MKINNRNHQSIAHSVFKVKRKAEYRNGLRLKQLLTYCGWRKLTAPLILDPVCEGEESLSERAPPPAFHKSGGFGRHKTAHHVLHTYTPASVSVGDTEVISESLCVCFIVSSC